jgi:hypothetical protein
MSITENEIMGGVGFGNDTSFYDHSVDFSNLMMRKPLKDQLMSNEEVSYIKGNPSSFREKVDRYAPDEIDNDDAVQKYLLNRISPSAQSSMGTFNSNLVNTGLMNRMSPVIEKFGNAAVVSSNFVNDNLVGLLLTLIFVLIVAIVVMQIMHTRKVYKIIKTMMKHIAELHHK